MRTIILTIKLDEYKWLTYGSCVEVNTILQHENIVYSKDSINRLKSSGTETGKYITKNLRDRALDINLPKEGSCRFIFLLDDEVVESENGAKFKSPAFQALMPQAECFEQACINIWIEPTGVCAGFTLDWKVMSEVERTIDRKLWNHLTVPISINLFSGDMSLPVVMLSGWHDHFHSTYDENQDSTVSEEMKRARKAHRGPHSTTSLYLTKTL